jgi:hypothetical protein
LTALRFPGLAAALLCAACGANTRDVVPESHDTVVAPQPAARAAGGYEYVAKRPLAMVALAEARGVPADAAQAAIDHLADALDACVTERSAGGSISGAARLVAQIDGNGQVANTSLRVDPGAGVAPTAVLCLVAPARMLTFPAADASLRGMAIEALWGHLPAGPANPSAP